MQRSLVQVAGPEEQERLARSLLDYISAREHLSADGCPILFLYPFLKKRNLPSAWLKSVLGELRMSGAVWEERNHYRVIGRIAAGEDAHIL